MSNRTTNCGKDRKQRDPDPAAAEIAMKRGAAKARENVTVHSNPSVKSAERVYSGH